MCDHGSAWGCTGSGEALTAYLCTGPRPQNAAHLLDRLVKDIVTESTSFSIEAFIPLLRERLTVLNPYVRQFLVGWITVLDGTPDIHMVEWLPHLLDGLLNMLSDPNREIRQQARASWLLLCQCGALTTLHRPTLRLLSSCKRSRRHHL